MENLSRNDYFKVIKSDLTLETFLNKKALTKERYEELKGKSILSLPIGGRLIWKIMLFCGGTKAFYLYCQENGPDNCFEYCVDKDRISTLVFNSLEEPLRLGFFTLTSIVLPIFCNLVSNFLNTNKDDRKIEINIIVQNNITSESLEVDFKGSKEYFQEKVIKTLEIYTKDGKIKESEQAGTKIDIVS